MTMWKDMARQDFLTKVYRNSLIVRQPLTGCGLQRQGHLSPA